MVILKSILVYRESASSGGGGGSVNSVNTGNLITVDNTDPTAPIVNLGGSASANTTLNLLTRTLSIIANDGNISIVLDETGGDQFSETKDGVTGYNQTHYTQAGDKQAGLINNAAVINIFVNDVSSGFETELRIGDGSTTIGSDNTAWPGLQYIGLNRSNLTLTSLIDKFLFYRREQSAIFYGDFGAMLAPYVNSASGTGATAAISSIAGTAGNPGTATCQTGSTSSGQAYVTLSASFNNFLLGGGAWFFDCTQYINVLSTVSERFVVITGYHDSPSTSDATDGCYFRYVDNVNSGNWQAITVSNSVSTGTVTDTGVAPSAATYQRFSIEVNAAGTQVTYYINGTQVAQHSANIPTGSGRQSTWCTGIRKTAGNTAMSLIVDYMNTYNELTTAR